MPPRELINLLAGALLLLTLIGAGARACVMRDLPAQPLPADVRYAILSHPAERLT